jgi:hypothetical protein
MACVRTAGLAEPQCIRHRAPAQRDLERADHADAYVLGISKSRSGRDRKASERVTFTSIADALRTLRQSSFSSEPDPWLGGAEKGR